MKNSVTGKQLAGAFTQLDVKSSVTGKQLAMSILFPRLEKLRHRETDGGEHSFS